MLHPAHSPLTLEEHQELSLEIRNSRERLLELSNLIFSVYGQRSFAAMSFSDLLAACERLCAELRLQAERDCPGAGTDELYR